MPDIGLGDSGEMMAAKKALIRVVIAEGNQAICQALCRLLRHVDGVEVVAVAADNETLFRQVAERRPAVALVGGLTAAHDSCGIIPRLLRDFPGLRIVALGIYPSQSDETLASGACRFVLLDASRGELLQAIQAAAVGDCQTEKGARDTAPSWRATLD